MDRRNVAGLQVSTDDVPSSLFLDGQYLDKTPYINKDIKPGQYTLKIQPDDQDLVPYETQISLRKGSLTVVTWNPGDKSENSGGIIYEMEEIKSNQGELSFITIPNNAIIKLDQGEQQFSPLVIKNIEPGHHQFEINLPSYQKQLHTINVIKGYRINITVKLAKATPTTNQATPKPTKTESKDATSEAEVSLNNNLVSTPSGSSSASGQLVTIKSTNFFQDGVEVLKVRQQASPSSKLVGYAQVGKSFPYLNEVSSGWFKIKFENDAGWVSDQYSKIDDE